MLVVLIKRCCSHGYKESLEVVKACKDFLLKSSNYRENNAYVVKYGITREMMKTNDYIVIDELGLCFPTSEVYNQEFMLNLTKTMQERSVIIK